MKTVFTRATIVASLFGLAFYSVAAERKGAFVSPTGGVSAALTTLEAAVRDYSDAEASVEALIAAVQDALGFLPKHSPVFDQLASAMAKYQEDGKSADLLQAVKETSSMLSFKPRKEADLPAGFPTYTPVGIVEVKEYPAYRMAVAGNFWTLFRHIQSNSIAMTTPVEMTYGPSESGDMSQQSMSFLYGDQETGEPGKEGAVEVVDVQPMTVVSIGVRGRRSQKAVEQAHQSLLRWLKASPDVEAVGDSRVMGYNSPMIRQADNYFEVQIPVRKP